MVNLLKLKFLLVLTLTMMTLLLNPVFLMMVAVALGLVQRSQNNFIIIFAIKKGRLI